MNNFLNSALKVNSTSKEISLLRTSSGLKENEPHVRDLHGGVGIIHFAEKDIFRLEVSMANIL